MSAVALQDVQNAPLALIGSARAGRRMLLDMLLSAKGYRIAACEDGPSVLEFLKENQPAIAIFDHDLPGMDGREICSRMRFITRLADTPIAIVTPAIEEMGGIAEFETFTDTTTADIVEAEPLGKKRLVERLENVIRDQKGAANDGKMTIAIPTMVPPIPEVQPATVAAAGNEVDVFVDDDVDIEVDVARAIYSNDGSFEQRGTEHEASAAEVAVESDARGVATGAGEFEGPVDLPHDSSTDQYATSSEDGPMMDEKQFEDSAPAEPGAAAQDDREPEFTEPAAEYDEEMFLAGDATAPAEAETSQEEDFDLFSHDAGTIEAEAATEQTSEWLESLIEEDEPAAAEPAQGDEQVLARESEPVRDEQVLAWDGDPARGDEQPLATETQPVDAPAEAGEEAELAAEEPEPAAKSTLVELVAGPDESDGSADAAGAASEGVAAATAPATTGGAVEYGSSENAGGYHSADSTDMDMSPRAVTDEEVAVEAERALQADTEDDLMATIEAAIEAVNLASMEEAEYLAAQEASERAVVEEELGEHHSGLPEQAEPPREGEPETASDLIDVKATVEMVVETADSNWSEPATASREPGLLAGSPPDEQNAPNEAHRLDSGEDEVELPTAAQPEPRVAVSPPVAEQATEHGSSETLRAGAKDYAEPSVDIRIESPSVAVDGQEEGEAAVLNEERANMQALIAEQAERIENLQERNVLLRQELEQRKADDALRNEERANLQALIKEQTEAITTLQQRNVQLRQELEQYKAEEAKRESERTFLQAHTSEQAETIAKLQQLNALLRQELEQRKADEAPLRDFLQRLLDRDEQNSAYQEAMRKEIISLTRENS